MLLPRMKLAVIFDRQDQFLAVGQVAVLAIGLNQARHHLFTFSNHANQWGVTAATRHKMDIGVRSALQKQAGDSHRLFIGWPDGNPSEANVQEWLPPLGS